MSDPAAIAAFLAARLDEAEAGALTAGLAAGMTDGTPGAEWVATPDAVDASGGIVATGCQRTMDAEIAEHIARWGPAHVLREVAAARRIIDLHARGHECSGYDHQGEIDPCRYFHTFEICSTLLLLASPYAEHADYESAWRIDGQAHV